MIKLNPRDYYEPMYTNDPMKALLELLQSKITDKDGTINISIPKEPNLNIPMWLVTDKDGATRIIKCEHKPVKNGEIWIPGDGDYMDSYIDSPFAAKFFGIFWQKAADELRKMGLPKWEDDPVEIEVSKIKINYY